MTRTSRTLSGERVFNALLANDREPFRALLEEMIGGRPTVEAIQEWAAKNPDRWAQAVGIFARLVGYDFKGTVAHDHTHRHLHLHTMSDSELAAEIGRLERGEAARPGASGEVDAATWAEMEDDVDLDEGGASGPGEGLW